MTEDKKQEDTITELRARNQMLKNQLDKALADNIRLYEENKQLKKQSA